ncbi:MAG: phosphotransferase family protein [Moraxellaceae bacterium]
MSLIDEARAVRQGEELDVATVDAYLKQQLPDLKGTPEILQFAGGASNLTYLLQYENRDLILRRPPFGKKAKSAHDMVREASIMQQLKPVYPVVPAVLALCQDESVMGCDFYVMERIVGVIPRQDFPEELLLSPQKTRELCQAFLDKLIELHKVDIKATGLDSLGKGEGYIARQISGWSERFRNARTPDVNDFEAVISWLEAKKPEKEIAITLIHNDWRLDNVVLDAKDPAHVIGVLDWEMATLGDPLMELGCVLTYWIQSDDDPVLQSMRRQPSNAAGMMTRDEVVSYYLAKTGYKVESTDFYFIYGIFRLAVIAQQIWYRYYNKQTDNPAFSQFGFMVNYLEQRCLTLIKASKI